MRRLGWCLLIAFLLTWSARAAPQDAPVEALPVTQIAQGIFVAQGPYELATPANANFICNIGFIVGTDAVAVIDTGGSLLVGRRLLKTIQARTNKPIRYVINTHDHPDHVLGNAAFAETGAVIVGHRNLPAALAARKQVYLDATRALIGEEAFAGTKVLPPTLLVGSHMDLDLGNRHLRLESWPPAHTDTDLTVLDETTQTWFLGDLLFAGHVPALDGSLRGWLATIDIIKGRAAARVVPGHGPRVMPWPEGLSPLRHYLEVVEADVRKSIRDGHTMQEAVKTVGQAERGQWELFDDFHARNVITAYHELEWE